MEEKETKKKSDGFVKVLHKATDIGKDVGKKVAEGVQVGTKALAETARNNNYTWKMKKYNPIFPKQFKSKNFNLPNMIVIVDDAVRRGIDVCEGAIGWLSTEKGVEILYLYDEWVHMCGIHFVPTAICDEVYYVDRFDRNRFIRVDCIFGKAHEERMAELGHIAFSLGAKSCTVEIEEYNSEVMVNHAQLGGKQHTTITPKANKEMDHDQESDDESTTKVVVSETGERSKRYVKVKSYSGRTTTYFEGDNEPSQPRLKWFAQDDGIKRLIEMRCSSKNTIKSMVLELEGAISATMSQKTACAIDGVLEKIMKVKVNMKMESEAQKEYHSKLIYRIEF